ncbi:alkaline shock response membrane anchor protein AmaP [Streptomyces sp. HNM0574]|uniref:alkaline shock response membrane anchor protein AmaP n=1 Tax=Streptomyces sp. HNM0574 TaxID=2714954 RepID=UPI00146AE6E4|nr:alkaline shock response membrane anchor protein AmaP [Streptomyces sp. HNM0574]NLU67428.1 alkaline shock response membrane anchor protein AmaP [Streptomyces sp. HNM0574]
MRRTVNRVLLGLTGAVLVAAGLLLLAGGFDLPARWNLSWMTGWYWSEPGDVVLSDADRTRWRDEGWWWPVVIAALAVLVLLALWWLFAQLRRRRLNEVLVDSGDGEGAVLRGRALEEALAAEAEALPGVDTARVRLVGRRTRPGARIRLALAPQAEPGPAVRRLRTETLEHARTSAGLERFPAEVRMRGVRHRAERVS